MNLPTAVKILLGYEASLKLAPGQKPPPPSPATYVQLSLAVAVVALSMQRSDVPDHVSALPPSVWSDWPLCCGLDLSPFELMEARSLPPAVLLDRGLQSLFLALHSCAHNRVKNAAAVAPIVLMTGGYLRSRARRNDPATFPSAHLAARVGHRLINEDQVLSFPAESEVSTGTGPSRLWPRCVEAPVCILASDSCRPRAGRGTVALPNEDAVFSLAKEAAALLDALCAAERNSQGAGSLRDRRQLESNSLPFMLGLQLAFLLDLVLNRTGDRSMGAGLDKYVYGVAAELPAYNNVLLLQSFVRNFDSGVGRGSMSNETWAQLLETFRIILWAGMSNSGPLAKLRPVDSYTAMRIGLEEWGQRPVDEDDRWSTHFFIFAHCALQSGLVQPELILRARPQLLEGLVEGLARGRLGSPQSFRQRHALRLLTNLARFPAVGFHLRRFFTRSGCLEAAQSSSSSNKCARELMRLLGPPAAPSDNKGPSPSSAAELAAMLRTVAQSRAEFRDIKGGLDPSAPMEVCDFIVRDLTPDTLREPRNAQPFLQYLSVLSEEIAASKRPYAHFGVLTVAGLGKACIAFSNTVARALQGMGEGGPSKGKGAKGLGGVGASFGQVGQAQERRRGLLVEMERELFVLRRRVLREVLPAVEAREAALWEGVREEEVMAALHG